MTLQGEPIALLSFASMAMMLLASTASDLLYHRIPNAFLVPALAVALLLGGFHDGLYGLLVSVAGLFAGMFVLMPLYVAGGTSAGDVKLLGVVGAYLGPMGALFAGIFTFIAGAVFALLWLTWISLRKLSHQELAISSSRQGNNLVADDKQEKSAFAYAPAILVGAISAVWFDGMRVWGG